MAGCEAQIALWITLWRNRAKRRQGCERPVECPVDYGKVFEDKYILIRSFLDFALCVERGLNPTLKLAHDVHKPVHKHAVVLLTTDTKKRYPLSGGYRFSRE